MNEEPLRRTLDNLRTGFQVIDFNWRYVYVNPAAAAHGRRTPDELVGHTMMEMYPGIEATPLFAVLRRCMTQRTAEFMHNLFMFPDGNLLWFEDRVEPSEEGLCVYSLDIHERKLHQIALEARNAHLEAREVPVVRRLLRALIGGSTRGEQE